MESNMAAAVSALAQVDTRIHSLTHTHTHRWREGERVLAWQRLMEKEMDGGLSGESARETGMPSTGKKRERLPAYTWS